MSEMVWHKTCVRCGGEMRDGMLLDYMGTMQTKWLDGPVEFGPKWTGGNPKVKKERVHRVMGYRCLDCGFVDLYLQPDDGDG
ncbi:MAG: hypothetical protein HKN04_10695 [Rhodothermaceae bacterium]|nr:hypothetical protein [Rhodothermaceae bacterium]